MASKALSESILGSCTNKKLAHVEGKASFSRMAKAGCLLYTEEGRMTWEGVRSQAPLQVKKEYILDLNAPATLGVYFAREPNTGKPVTEPTEETFYVSFPLPGSSSSMGDTAIDSSTHLCGKDVYKARVEMRCAQQEEGARSSSPRGSSGAATQHFSFSTKCEVAGPKKDHLIHTDYRR